MGSRLELQTLLAAIPGVAAVYFQPPATVSMTYPCVVYDLSDIDAKHANNKPYILTNEYTLTVIDKDPDTAIIFDIAKLPSCEFNRFFASDGLNHYVFTLNF